MEKLQSAIENARKKRGASPAQSASDVPTEGPAILKGAADRSKQMWADLEDLPLNSSHLIKKCIFTQHAIKEASYFDILRTKTVLTMRQKGWRRMAITSPTALCGKSTTISNIAVSLGRQADIKTVLFDMDLRRPSLHQIFDHKPARNIMELLRGEVSFNEQALRIGKNVALSLTGRRATDSTQYMLNDQTAEVLNEIEVTHKPDLMLFDLPPLLGIDDTHAFLKNVDCILLVARAEETTASQIKNCCEEIEKHTNILGVVMAQCRHTTEENSDGYY